MNPLILPKQGHLLNKRVSVVMHRDDGKEPSPRYGFVVRNDHAMPFYTIVKLDCGTYVLGSECVISVV